MYYADDTHVYLRDLFTWRGGNLDRLIGFNPKNPHEKHIDIEKLKVLWKQGEAEEEMR